MGFDAHGSTDIRGPVSEDCDLVSPIGGGHGEAIVDDLLLEPPALVCEECLMCFGNCWALPVLAEFNVLWLPSSCKILLLWNPHFLVSLSENQKWLFKNQFPNNG